MPREQAPIQYGIRASMGGKGVRALHDHYDRLQHRQMKKEDPDSTVECGVCQDSTPWSRISSELLNGELVCHTCMSMEPWVFQDPYTKSRIILK